ncbi:uncharacterized protein M6B38_154275 [Iris pallida]|uniref:Uncharacterized protein n=1 Tax=Iris pallida TaxID=29817 RepID=A0AAX6F4U4_IRIPA|nr:uncharacterized protein M6B38_154275 [Iris pallida]
MPHFTAIALDRLLEPGSRNPKPPPVPVRLGRELSYSEKKSIPPRPPHAVSPTLYATPEATPLPDSPSSFPPSPYIVNHKRRGPRLLKSLSQTNVVNNSDSGLSALDQKVEVPSPKHVQLEVVLNGNGNGNGNHVNNDPENALVVVEEENDKSPALEIERDDLEYFCDLMDSMSTASNTEVDDITGGERLWKPTTPGAEYYDAFEEISGDSGTRSSCRNVEDELREMRLNFLTEIERRKQAEEALENFQNQWQNLRHQLSLVGLTLPALPAVTDDTVEQPNNPAEELYQQVFIAKFVAASVGRACSRAEVEMEMEPQIQLKNFEIARLSDRLQYYEAANREMSQRNQEAVEMARQHRHRRKRRQRWLWSSIGLAVTLGSAAIAWSYIPASKPPSHEGGTSTSHSD